MARLELTFECKDESLSVRHFCVHEQMSKLFEISVLALSPNDELDLETFVGKKAGLSLEGAARGGLAALASGDAPESVRAWTGVVRHMEQLQAEDGGLATYAVRIVPRLWLLTQKRQNRIFQHLTIPAIVTKVMGEHGVDAELRLVEEHGEHEYRAQFDESDFDFCCRLLEEEGISFHFEQTEDDAGFSSQLVLSDQPQKAKTRAGGPLRFVDNPNQAPVRQYVTHVRIAHGVRPGRVTIRDYELAKADRALVGRSDVAKGPEDVYEHYLYLPAAFIKERRDAPRTPGDAETKALADVALQARRRGKRHVELGSNALDLAPGMVVSMSHHPRRDLAPDKTLLLYECTTEGDHDGDWRLEARAVFTDVPFRPEQLTPKPRVPGVQSAIVVGPPGEEIHTDAYGRVKVHFHWARELDLDEAASCWVRVSQGWAGPGWGMFLLPRVGHEVLVDFFDGDPDQPIVVGSAFNGRTRVPYQLAREKTRSVWKSNSSPKSDGFNELTMEDKAGKELVYVQAQRDLSKLVKADEIERTGADRLTIVGKSRSAVVAENDTVAVGKKHLVATIAPGNLRILELGDPELTVQTTLVDAVDGTIRKTTGKATSILSGGDITLGASGNVNIQCGGTVFIDGGPNVYINSKSVSGVSARAKPEAKDGAAKPEGRVLDSIKKLFGLKTEIEKKAVEAELRVPHRIQKGPTCGIAALGMVMDYWHGKDEKNQAPDADTMLKKAQDQKYTDTGGMSVSDERDLARDYGYDAKIERGASLDDLKKSVGDGKPALVTFSVDKAGEPQKATDRGHYAVIKGFFTKDGKDYVVAQHGWSSAARKVWDAKVFEESWKAYSDGAMVVVTPK